MGKEYVKALYCDPAYLTSAEYVTQNAGQKKYQKP